MKGFTLLEIMIVVVIVGLLATVTITQLSGKTDQAKYETTRAKLSQIVDNIQMYLTDCSKLPEKLEDLIVMPGGLEKKWHGPYLKESFDLKDDWGNDFNYRKIDERKFEVISYAADGKEGGEEFSEDLVYPPRKK